MPRWKPVYLDHGFYSIPTEAARRLSKASPLGRLPGAGMETVVEYEGKYWMLARTRTQGKTVWSIRETQWRHRPGGGMVMAPLENPGGAMRLPSVKGDLIAIPFKRSRIGSKVIYKLYLNGQLVKEGSVAEITAEAQRLSGGMRQAREERQVPEEEKRRRFPVRSNPDFSRPGSPEWLQAKSTGPRWKYEDGRGVVHEGYMEKYFDKGGRDQTAFMRDRFTGELSVISGSKLKSMSRSNPGRHL